MLPILPRRDAISSRKGQDAAASVDAGVFSNECGVGSHLKTIAATAQISCLSTFHERRTFLSARDLTDPKLRTRYSGFPSSPAARAALDGREEASTHEGRKDFREAHSAPHAPFSKDPLPQARKSWHAFSATCHLDLKNAARHFECRDFTGSERGEFSAERDMNEQMLILTGSGPLPLLGVLGDMTLNDAPSKAPARPR